MRMKLFSFILRVHFSLFDVGCRLDGSWSWGCCNWGVSHRNPIIMCNQYFCCSSSSGLCLSCMRPERMCSTADQLETGSVGRIACSAVLRHVDNKEIFQGGCCLFSSILSNCNQLVALFQKLSDYIGSPNINRLTYYRLLFKIVAFFSIKSIDIFTCQFQLSFK